MEKGQVSNMELLLIARILIALVGTGIAAWYDICNKKDVPDKFLYTFLAIAIIINIFDYSQVISRLPLAALLLIVLFLMYKFGQLGGADLIVLAAIYFSLPVMTSPLLSQASAPVAEILALPSLFTILALSVVLCALYLAIKFGPKIAADTAKRKVKFKLVNIIMGVIMLIVYCFLLFMIIQLSSIIPVSVIHIAFLTLIVILVFFFSLYKDVLLQYMIIWKKKIAPEEVIMLEALPLALVQRMHLGRLVTPQQMKKMNKLGRKWPVLDLPAFLPFILIALVFYILLGDSILFFV